jgi:hypothetical protein
MTMVAQRRRLLEAFQFMDTNGMVCQIKVFVLYKSVFNAMICSNKWPGENKGSVSI